MNIDTNLLNEIYKRLGDDQSKEIFKNRLMYSISNDSKWIHKIIKNTDLGKNFFKQLELISKQGEIVIWGAGLWGKDLYKITNNYPWKYFVDNSPKTDVYCGIPIIKGNNFLDNYNNEYIFISSRIYYEEIYQYIKNHGISEDKIVNVGKFLDTFSQRQYFDLEYLIPGKEEIFVDVGSFDGLTSLRFSQWANNGSFTYLFEPEPQNIEKCHKNLKESGVNYSIISRGAWNKRGILRFNANINGASNIDDSGDTEIEVTTIDEELGKENITFIKMDIEGAELQALEGAKEVITNYKPKLAISIYHKPEDIWTIPEIILEYYSEYRFYLRHYSLTDYETVLYAI